MTVAEAREAVIKAQDDLDNCCWEWNGEGGLRRFPTVDSYNEYRDAALDRFELAVKASMPCYLTYDHYPLENGIPLVAKHPCSSKQPCPSCQAREEVKDA